MIWESEKEKNEVFPLTGSKWIGGKICIQFNYHTMGLISTCRRNEFHQSHADIDLTPNMMSCFCGSSQHFARPSYRIFRMNWMRTVEMNDNGFLKEGKYSLEYNHKYTKSSVKFPWFMWWSIALAQFIYFFSAGSFAHSFHPVYQGFSLHGLNFHQLLISLHLENDVQRFGWTALLFPASVCVCVWSQACNYISSAKYINDNGINARERTTNWWIWSGKKYWPLPEHGIRNEWSERGGRKRASAFV